jgi:hypothetical protein
MSISRCVSKISGGTNALTGDASRARPVIGQSWETDGRPARGTDANEEVWDRVVRLAARAEAGIATRGGAEYQGAGGDWTVNGTRAGELGPRFSLACEPWVRGLDV